MDPVKDEIDPSWWEDVLAPVPLDDPHAPIYSLSRHLSEAAEADSVAGFQRLVLETLAVVTSAMPSFENWHEPFAPAIQFGGKRSPIPADLGPDQLALLSRIAPLIERPDLRARVSDVAWFYGDRSDVAMLDRAIDAYRAASLNGDAWVIGGRESWVRALDLAARRGPDGHSQMQEMSDALRTQILASKVEDAFRPVALAEVLREHGRVGGNERAEVCAALISLAAQTSSSDPRLSRHLEREALAWLAGDAMAAAAATERIARTYVAQADARIRAEPQSGALAEGHFIEKAIAVLRSIPRSYRIANGLDTLLDELRARLLEARESAIEQMERFELGPVDLNEAVTHARSRVSGHATAFDALAAFATLAPPMNEAETRESAVKLVEDSFSRLFPTTTFSSDHRKVASRSGASDPADEESVWAEMVRAVHIHSQLVGIGLVRPALEVLTTEHNISRQHLVSLCAESPLVPQGHERLWGEGLVLGFSGNLAAAVSLLVPQLEQVIRVMLKRQNVYTLVVDEQGVESEKSLNALLDMPETATIFGAGMVMEMKAMLVVPGSTNLRNVIAHGLLDDGSAWSYSALYMWWFSLRLVMWPLIEMVGDSQSPAEEPTAEAMTREP